jgi:hypothetical protein
MSVTVDDRTLAAEELGLETVGEVLAHVQKARRLVVQVLIDGQEPDLGRMGVVRSRPLRGHTLYIETTEPKAMALEVLEALEEQLEEADRLKRESAELLNLGQQPKAMEKLSGVFTIWHTAQESMIKTAQLLKLEMDTITVNGTPLPEVLEQFTHQLRQIRSALESRDFVTLGDILTYETSQTSDQWRQALEQMRAAVED